MAAAAAAADLDPPSPRSPKLTLRKVAPADIIKSRSPLRSSARPAYDVSNIQRMGTNSCRKLPHKQEHEKQIDDRGSAQAPAHFLGLKRFDDQRPTGYISQNLYVNEERQVQVTLVSEPHTSWAAERLTDKPYSGVDPAVGEVVGSGDFVELGKDERLERRRKGRPSRAAVFLKDVGQTGV